MKLARLPSLPKIGSARLLRMPAGPKLPVGEALTIKEPPIVVVPPFSSTWEVWLDGWLRERDPYWSPQVWFGVPFEWGSTRPDWVHEPKKIALYLDSPVHALRGRQEHDIIQRQFVEEAGYRVVAWWANSLPHLKAMIAQWYAHDIEK